MAPLDTDFFICRVHKSDGVSEVGEYITRKGVKFRKLTKASNDNAKLNSLKLTISVVDLNKSGCYILWRSIQRVGHCPVATYSGVQ